MQSVSLHVIENNRKLTSISITVPYICLSALTALWMIFTVFCVEFTLNFNHVAGVLAGEGNAAPGQLLPLLVGLFSLVRLLWIIYKQRIVERTVDRKLQSPSDSPDLRQSSQSRYDRFMEPESIMVGLITAWLPWLNCFETWRNRVGIKRRSTEKFHLLPHHENNTEGEDALKVRVGHFENQPEGDRYE